MGSKLAETDPGGTEVAVSEAEGRTSGLLQGGASRGHGWGGRQDGDSLWAKAAHFSIGLTGLGWVLAEGTAPQGSIGQGQALPGDPETVCPQRTSPYQPVLDATLAVGGGPAMAKPHPGLRGLSS